MATAHEIQTALKKLGLYHDDIDGLLGRNSIKAISTFQKMHGLEGSGIIGPKTLKLLFPDDVSKTDLEATVPPWITLGLHKLGLNEKANNKSLREWLKSDGNTLGDPAKLPWCGDFMETIIALTLPEEPMVTNPYYALNWTKFGVAIPTGQFPLGGITPFKRDGGGHIATIVGHDANHFHCLGGNQSNAITISKIDKGRLSGHIRWPCTYPLPTGNMPFTTIDATVTRNEA